MSWTNPCRRAWQVCCGRDNWRFGVSTSRRSAAGVAHSYYLHANKGSVLVKLAMLLDINTCVRYAVVGSGGRVEGACGASRGFWRGIKTGGSQGESMWFIQVHTCRPWVGNVRMPCMVHAGQRLARYAHALSCPAVCNWDSPIFLHHAVE